MTSSLIDSDGNTWTPEDINTLAQAGYDLGDAARKRSTGGEQLLRGTNICKKLTTSGAWQSAAWRAASGGGGTRSQLDIEGCPANSVTTGWHIVGGSGYTEIAQDSVPVIGGQRYTLSCYASGGGVLTIQVGSGEYLRHEFQTSGGWKRYALTFEAGSDGAAVVADATNVFFGAKSGTVDICGMKLERGDVVSDWSAHKLDVENDAATKANEALAKANDNAKSWVDESLEESKRYVDEITDKDRAFTEEQVSSLDNALNQYGIIQRLTDNFRWQGFKTQDGKLYINAEYIRAGVLDGGIVRAGILASKAAWDYYAKHGKSFGENTYWNMSTGYFQTKNAKMVNARVEGQFSCGTNSGSLVELSNGKVKGFQNKQLVGYIDATAATTDLQTGIVYKGLQVQSDGMLRISVPRLAVANSKYVTELATWAFTGIKRINVVESIRVSGDTISWTTAEHGIEVKNGLITAIW